MILRLLLNLTDVSLVVPLIVLLLVLFAVSVRSFSLLVVLVLLAHDLSALGLGALDGLAVLVLMMLDLLQMRHNKGVVCLFLPLHLGVEVLNLGLQLFDLLPCVLIEIVDHVLLDLERVALHLGIRQLLSQILDGDLELFSPHGEELVLRLRLLLLFLAFLFLFAGHVAAKLSLF